MLNFDMTNEAYHAGPGVSNSGISLALKSARHYHAAYLDPNRPPREEKPGQLEGTLAHCAILEPEEFDKRYVRGPDVRVGTKAWNAVVDAEPDRTVVKPNQYDVARLQAISVRACKELAHVWESCLTEVTAFATDEDTGMLCKCRPDIVFDTGDAVILLDVKTYSSAAIKDFSDQVFRKGYYRQDAWYRKVYSPASGRVVSGFYFVAVEDSYPFVSRVFEIDEELLNRGREECELGLRRISDSIKSGVWCGYPDGVAVVRMPGYAKSISFSTS